MTKRYVLVKGDTNDADYASNFEEIEDDETYNAIVKVAKAVKSFKPYKGLKMDWTENSYWTHNHNWPSGEYVRTDLGEKTPEQLYVETGLITEEEMENFSEIVPHDIHTIEEIRIVEVSKDTKLV